MAESEIDSLGKQIQGNRVIQFMTILQTLKRPQTGGSCFDPLDTILNSLMRRPNACVADVQAIIDARQVLSAGPPTGRIQRQRCRDRFAVGGADKIFERTYSHQTQKRGD